MFSMWRSLLFKGVSKKGLFQTQTSLFSEGVSAKFLVLPSQFLVFERFQSFRMILMRKKYYWLKFSFRSIDVAMDTSILQSSRLVPLKEVENLSQQNQWPLGSSMQINRFWYFLSWLTFDLVQCIEKSKLYICFLYTLLINVSYSKGQTRSECGESTSKRETE